MAMEHLVMCVQMHILTDSISLCLSTAFYNLSVSWGQDSSRLESPVKK